MVSVDSVVSVVSVDSVVRLAFDFLVTGRRRRDRDIFVLYVFE